MRIVVVGLHCDRSSRILVQQRPEHRPRGGLWELPGGKVEDGETMYQALVREWREELGAEIQVGRLLDEVVIHFDGEERPTLLPLFRVWVPSETPPRSLEGQRFAYKTWEEIKALPCVPSMALYERTITSHLGRF